LNRPTGSEVTPLARHAARAWQRKTVKPVKAFGHTFQASKRRGSRKSYLF
jgi:hypothetical protein